MYNFKEITDERIAAELPHVMGTQHPDNAAAVPFGDSPMVSQALEEDELLYNVLSLSVKEMMIDYERKRGDVTPLWDWIHKCLSCMQEKAIGRDFHVTPRIPNGDTERDDPYFWQSMGIFINELLVMHRIGLPGMAFTEFIVPNVTQGVTVARTEQHILQRYELQRKQYREYGDGAAFPFDSELFVQGIPLIETVEALISPEAIWDDMVAARRRWIGKETHVQRSFIARSDPALKAGMLAALIAAAVALEKGRIYEKKTGIRIPQIVGIGSAPFRGGLIPDAERIDAVLATYPGMATVTAQSAFRYDYPMDAVTEACTKLDESIGQGWLDRHQLASPLEIDDFDDVKEIVSVLKRHYEATYKEIVEMIYKVIPHIPSHRERYADVSVAGVSRNVGGLPAVRAIKFAASCYTLGIPPGLLGLRAWAALGADQKKKVEKICPTFRYWIGQEIRWLNTDNLDALQKKFKLNLVAEDITTGRSLAEENEIDDHHREITGRIPHLLDQEADLAPIVMQAAAHRRFLG